MFAGDEPTGIVATTVFVLLSMRYTVFVAGLAAKMSFAPSNGSYATAEPPDPTGTVATIVLVSLDMTCTVPAVVATYMFLLWSKGSNAIAPGIALVGTVVTN